MPSEEALPPKGKELELLSQLESREKKSRPEFDKAPGSARLLLASVGIFLKTTQRPHR
jgi:hypothetical protein